MKCNEGPIDRGLRVLAGLLLIGATLGAWIGPWGWIGLVPLLTGVTGFCPLYWPLGYSTCRNGSKR